MNNPSPRTLPNSFWTKRHFHSVKRHRVNDLGHVASSSIPCPLSFDNNYVLKHEAGAVTRCNDLLHFDSVEVTESLATHSRSEFKSTRRIHAPELAEIRRIEHGTTSA